MKRRPLSEYTERLRLEGLGFSSYMSEKEPTVEYLSYSSRDVRPGTLFICKGAAFKPEYLEEAINSGAVAALVPKGAKELISIAQNRGISVIEAENLRLAMSLIADSYFESVWKKLKIAAVTGTKGKSTVVYILKAIVEEYESASGGKPPAILSSIDTFDGVVLEESHLTTPEPIELYRHFENAVNSGLSCLLMEASSQALKYERLSCVRFSAAAFLNIGRDHISEIEHPDFEDYFGAKLKILEKTAVCFVSGEMEESYRKRIYEAAEKAGCRIRSFGFDESNELFAFGIRALEDGTAFSIGRKGRPERDELKLSLHGTFNVLNALAAIMLAEELGIPYEYIKSGLKKAFVPGRMELFKVKGRVFIVDYAHNELSFNALFDAVKASYPDAGISIVFGCPGGKAYNRRSELTKIASERADRIYLTEEDPGPEDVLDICREMGENIERFSAGKAQYSIIPDREEAIRRAFAESCEGQVILLTAKGRETRQKRGSEYIDVRSDVEIVEDIMREA